MKRPADMRTRTTDQLTRTAYHEAGHALAAFTPLVPIKLVTIIPKSGAVGCVILGQRQLTASQASSMSPRVRDRFERSIVISLSGREGERLITGHYRHLGARGD